MTLTMVHEGLARAAVIFSIICALWGLINYVREQPVTSGYLGALALCTILFVAQGVLGVVLFLQGQQPYRVAMHILYGTVGIITIPAAFLYSQGRDARRENLLYAIVCLFLMGIALRSMTTGYIPAP